MAQLPKLTLGRLKEFVAQHAPVLHMHPRDAFMPCSVEWFMDHSELWLLEKENVSTPTNIWPSNSLEAKDATKFQDCALLLKFKLPSKCPRTGLCQVHWHGSCSPDFKLWN